MENDYKEIAEEAFKVIKSIRARLICINGPFNDNKNQFNIDQLKELQPILEDCGDFLESHYCHECERLK